MPDAPTISDVIAAAGAPGNPHCRAVLGAPYHSLIALAKPYGLELEEFHHSIDAFAVRHIRMRHGDAAIERSRKQIAIEDADIQTIPEILKSPDQLIFGGTSRRRQSMIVYIKRMPSAVVVYLEEVRQGRRDLAALSMRKHPAGTLSGDIVATLESNGRTDGGDRFLIVDVPPNVTAIIPSRNADPATSDAGELIADVRLDGRTDNGDRLDVVDMPPNFTANTAQPPAKLTMRRTVKFLPPTLGLLVLAGIVFGLHGALKHIRPGDVIAALAATSAHQILHAFTLLACSFCIMAIYDVPGILFARRLIDFPRLGLRRIALASFSAYALSHVLGAPALTGAAIRLRLYAAWSVPPAGIARIVALSGTSFILGAALLGSLILLLAPHSLPLFGHSITATGLRAIGAVLLGLILLYILLAGRRSQLNLFGWQVPLPGSLLACLQLLISCADTTIAGGILFVILPAIPGLSLPHILAIYLAAFAGGLFSGLPGGLGVFDTLLLLGLSPYLDPAAAIGAILLFRLIYFLVPAGAAGLCFAAHEIFLTAKGQN